MPTGRIGCSNGGPLNGDTECGREPKRRRSPGRAKRPAYRNPAQRRFARLAASAAVLALLGCAPKQHFVRAGATPVDDLIVTQECRVVAMTAQPPYEPGLPDRGYSHHHASLGDGLGLLAVVALHQAVVGSWREEVFRDCLRAVGYIRVE